MTDTLGTAAPQEFDGKAGAGPVATLGDFLAAHGIDVTAPVHAFINPSLKKSQPAPFALEKAVDPKLGGTYQPPAKETKMVPSTFDLSSALAQYVAPYMKQLDQASGVGSNGKATPSSEIPGLAGYLANMTPQEQATITPYLNQQASEASKLPDVLKKSIADAGTAGLLTDLLNAAKYQAIYKQANYAPSPPSDTPLGQLYAAVVAGGNQLAGGTTSSSLPTGTQTGSKTTSTNGVSPLNPYNINGTPQS